MSAPSNYPSAQAPPRSFQPAKLEYLQGGPVRFDQAITQAFRNAFVYRGRASRSAYWWFALFQIFLILAFKVSVSTGNSPSARADALIIFIVVWIGPGLANLALTVRRLHDTGRSGWWFLISLVPLVGPIALLIFTLQEGTPGLNRYGP